MLTRQSARRARREGAAAAGRAISAGCRPSSTPRPFSAAAARQRPANDVPVLLSVGMMRTRDKLASYRVLSQAFALLRNRPWKALLVGDGPARDEIERMMAPFGERIRFAGALPHAALPRCLCRRRPLSLAGDQRGLWHGLPRGPGGRPARRRRPNRRRARRGDRRRHRHADADRRSRGVRRRRRPSARAARRTGAARRRRREPHRHPSRRARRRHTRWRPRSALLR